MKLTLLTSDPPVFHIANDRTWSVRLQPVPGERGRFYAPSLTRFRCPGCSATYTRKSGDPTCNKCQAPGEPVTYLVDVLENGGRGKCSCESHTCNRRDEPSGEAWTPDKHVAAAMLLFGYMTANDAAAAERQEVP